MRIVACGLPLNGVDGREAKYTLQFPHNPYNATITAHHTDCFAPTRSAWPLARNLWFRVAQPDVQRMPINLYTTDFEIGGER